MRSAYTKTNLSRCIPITVKTFSRNLQPFRYDQRFLSFMKEDSLNVLDHDFVIPINTIRVHAVRADKNHIDREVTHAEGV